MGLLNPLNAIPLPYRIGLYALVLASLVGGSVLYGYNKAENKYITKIAKMEATAEVMQAKLDAALSEVKVEVLTKYIDKIKIVKEKEYVYRDKIVTVPSKCELSNGWVWLHDLAATGKLPDTTGEVDGDSENAKDDKDGSTN